ncbi:MFS transporter [Streptosporangium sp. 'caverna']|uniref:MFS transporter n=1 Tax=Streptosporangium sp. 'caverna' TaxID=2202249 RepID=UPI000D7DC90A|nr:MFS transporter [Streptosporangium sp. 'caverna']AWS42036.1 MFS transporter [Streptosporangium sp. 'caverna']
MSAATPPASPAPLGRPFAWLWGSATFSNLADGLALLVLPLLALSLTDSPSLIAGVSTAFTLPWLLFGLVAGLVIDRVDRRRIILYANFARGAVLAVICGAALAGELSLPLLYAVAFLLGSAETFADLSGSALVPMIVSTGNLSRANSRFEGTRVAMNNFVGGPLAGALITLGAVAALSVPAALYLLSALTLFAIRGAYASPRSGPMSLRADVREGVTVVWRDPLIRLIVVMAGTLNLLHAAFMAVFIVYAVGQTAALGLSEIGYGTLLTVSAVGAVLGALASSRVERHWSPAVILTTSVLINAVFFVVCALVPNVFAVGAAFFASTFATGIVNVIIVTIRQKAIPTHLMGRVLAAARLVVFGTRPLGALLGGLLAGASSPRTLFLVLAVASLPVMLLTVRVPGDANS